LAAARACIREGEGKNGAENDLAFCHRAIAAILNSRNVYTEALSHSKESIALNNTDPMAYGAMAEALRGLGRSREAINAATEALKLSDGKYAIMHFTLGSAYFDIEDWRNAEQSFRKAAELAPTDSAAAYNVALCLARQGYYHDAATWYEEVLRRNPRHQERDEILQKIRVLKSQ
jgi:tetratricopeptide (TPR) repeat protein